MAHVKTTHILEIQILLHKYSRQRTPIEVSYRIVISWHINVTKGKKVSDQINTGIKFDFVTKIITHVI